MHFAAVLEHSPQPGLLKAELLLHHWNGSSPLVRICAFAVSTRSSNRPSGVPGSTRRLPGRMATRNPTLHLVTLLNSLVASIGIDHGFLAVEEISGWGEVMHMGSRDVHRVD